MKKGDRIIWNSGFGYEIGYFVEFLENKTLDYDCKVELITGVVQGVTMKNFNEIEQYTDKRQSHLKSKYGYDKAFSKCF